LNTSIDESLPYIGSKDDSGKLKFVGIEIERPDYNAIKRNKEQISELLFIGTLLGLSSESFIQLCDYGNCQYYESYNSEDS
jgi:hypothetical protein